MERHKAWLHNVPKGTCVHADRGFEFSARHYVHLNRHFLPSYKRKSSIHSGLDESARCILVVRAALDESEASI